MVPFIHNLKSLLSGAAREKFRHREATRAINERIFDTSIDLILVVDRTGNLIRVSPSSATILGYQPEEMTGRNATQFICPDDLQNTRDEMRLARRGRLTRNFDCRYMHKDGHAVPLVWTGVWSDPEQQHFFIGRDMTERNAQEERLRRAQRLEAIGQLTGGIAHDFNNLLAVVVGNLDMLSSRLERNSDCNQFVETAMQASLRGAELTQQLLAFARRQPLNAQTIDINDRVKSTIGLLRRTLGEQIKISTDLAPDLWLAHIDPAQFESALVNLAINARDAMRDGGQLIIETENREIDEYYARAHADLLPGNYVMVAVSDTGTGMSPETLAHAFEPFFTTKAPGEGTGLGLSMVYGFTKQSHGHIRIYSELGRGTTIRLYLPKAEGAAVWSPSPDNASAPVSRGGEVILVVEDNADVRKIVVSQLTELGYRSLEAENGEIALGIINGDTPVDLLLTDVVMPGAISGDELALTARKIRPDMKILLTSGFAKATLQEGPRAALLDNFLSKPYRKAELAAKLRDVLDAAD